MKKQILILFILSGLLLSIQDSIAQCTGCTFTAANNGNYNLNGGQKLCITSNVSGINISSNGASNSICVGTGSTWTQTNGDLSNLVIDVYGTYLMNSNYNFNSGVIINIRPGGVVQTSAINFNGNLTINNYGTLTYTSTNGISLPGTTITNFASGIITAPNTSLLKFDSNSSLFNYGTLSTTNLENQEGNIQNFAGSSITVGRNFYNHGNFINNSTVNILCSLTPITNLAPCGFRVGNKGPGKEFTNNGCMTVNGPVTFDGPGFINGTLEILGLNSLTLNAIVSGTNGRIIVNQGLSTISSAGQYTGTNMRFCDRSSINGNRFDLNLGNATSTYTTDCSANTCGAAVCALSLSATPGTCVPATNQYSVTGTVSLTNNTAGGTLTIADGGNTTTVTVPASASAASFTLTGFVSNGSSHTITASLPNCGSAVQTYTAPASCSCAAITVTASRSSSAICQGQSVQLTAQVSPAGSYTYAWAGSGTITNGNTATATVSGLTTGTYTFTVTVFSSPVCSTTATTTVTVNPLPTPTLSSATICTGTSAVLTATGGTSYTLLNTGTVSASGSFTLSPTATTTYTVVAANASSCTATATGTITVNPLPVISVTNTGPLTCTLTTVTVSASSTAAQVSYRWSGPNNFTSNAASFTTATAGTYSVTATGATGCITTATTTVQSNTLTPTLSASNNGPLTCAITTVTLSTTVGNATNPTYLWSTGATSPLTTVMAPGIYSVTVTSANGCTATATTQVQTEAVVLCPKVSINKL